jgi:pyruvate dehydrogenase E2 component (dihydrolipoamide acetyltransferase)
LDVLTLMSNAYEVQVPDIGDFSDIPVIEVLVKVGDLVLPEQALVTLESDKATLDVPSPVAGTVAELRVSPGTRVSRGSVILVLQEGGKSREPPALAATPLACAAPSPEALPLEPPKPTPFEPRNADALALEGGESQRVYASPSVRRLGRELGADLTQVSGSARGGRIVRDDVHQFVQHKMQDAPEPAGGTSTPRSLAKIDFAKYGEIERQPLSRIRRISGPVLARSWATIPHVTNFDEADVTDLESFRAILKKEIGEDLRLTMLSFLVKAAASALRLAPAFNASLDGDDLILKKYTNVGVAMDTPGGLVVPVIRGVDALGLIDIARQLQHLSSAARSGKLKPGDFEGGCFTISSLGGIGGTGFTPIINAPEIAILGAARARIQPRYDGGDFQPRLILPLALSWDHRASDGAAAARFLASLAAMLTDFRRISL